MGIPIPIPGSGGSEGYYTTFIVATLVVVGLLAWAVSPDSVDPRDVANARAAEHQRALDEVRRAAEADAAAAAAAAAAAKAEEEKRAAAKAAVDVAADRAGQLMTEAAAQTVPDEQTRLCRAALDVVYGVAGNVDDARLTRLRNDARRCIDARQ